MDYMKDPGWQYLKLSPEEVLKNQSRPYDSKKNVWIPDPEDGYIAAEIKSTKGDMVTLTTSKGGEVITICSHASKRFISHSISDNYQKRSVPRNESTEVRSHRRYVKFVVSE